MSDLKKLWEKGTSVEKKVENFTIGKDRQLDLPLAEYDVLGSIAQAIMLESVGLISKEDVALAAEFGVKDYLIKPFTKKDLKEKVQGLTKNILNPSFW